MDARRIIYLFSVLLLLLCARQSHAFELALVSHQPTSLVKNLEQKIQSHFALQEKNKAEGHAGSSETSSLEAGSLKKTLNISSLSLSGQSTEGHEDDRNDQQKIQWHKFDLIVLLGAKTLARWQGPSENTLAVMVSYNQWLQHQHKNQKKDQQKVSSAIFIEPPLARQIHLADAIISPMAQIGILVQDQSSWQQLQQSQLQYLTVDQKQRIHAYRIDEYASLNRALMALLKHNQVLLGVYDQQLFSANHIKNILITAYRHGKPLIGPSKAYIKAGALASTYSDLDDIAHRIVDLVYWQKRAEKKSGSASLPAAHYNPYFKLQYNQQVGRSLNLALPPVHALLKQLQQADKQEVQR